MARNKGNDGWWFVGGLFLVALYYMRTGPGKENDSALIPNTIEEKIDAVVRALNERFTNLWINFGISALRNHLLSTPLAPFVSLVEIVATVENVSKGWMTGPEKQQLAAQMARGTYHLLQSRNTW